jgi:hypothetical protein
MSNSNSSGIKGAVLTTAIKDPGRRWIIVEKGSINWQNMK